MALIEEQARRINRLQGKVSVVVTDSPILLGLLYRKEQYVDLENIAFERYASHKNLDFLVRRRNYHNFEQAGRMHTLEQSILLDTDSRILLKMYGIPYLEYNRNESFKTVMTVLDLISSKKKTRVKNYKIHR